MATHKLTMKMSECPVCLIQYDLRDRLPKGLRCFHTICKCCLDNLASGKSSLQCPTCRRECDVKDVATNYALVDVLETLCESCIGDDRHGLCHHCQKHLCKSCLNKHATDFHSEVKQNLQTLLQEMKQSVEVSLDQTVLEEERKREECALDDLRKAIKHHQDELDRLQKELEVKIREKKDKNVQKHITWRENLDLEIAKVKQFLDKSENVLGTKYTDNCTTADMSDVNKDCLTSLAELKKVKDGAPFLCPYKFEADQAPASVGRVVWSASKYKLAKFKCKTGSKGSGRKKLCRPISVAYGDGKFVVTDKGNHRIKVYDEDLKVQYVFGQQGSGYEDFNQPWCAIVGQDNLLYITDPVNYRIKICTMDGKTIRTIGVEGKGELEFNLPMGIDIQGEEIFVCDRNNFRIHVFNSHGIFRKFIGSQESGMGQFKNPPRYLLITRDKKLIVSEKNSNEVKVFDKYHNFSTKFPTGFSKEVANMNVVGMTEDNEGNILIADETNNRLVVLNKHGEFVCTVGKKGDGDGELNAPTGVCVCHNGDFVVCDSNNHRLQMFEILL